MMRNLETALAALMVGWFSIGATAADQPQDEGPAAHAVLTDASGHQIGTAEVGEDGGILHVAVDVNHLPAGRYAVHIHSVGRCNGPRFESAGGHWNPTNTHHGVENANGPHMGDLPNLAINANGRGFFESTLTGEGHISGGRNAVLDADGAAVVIHAGEDDFRTDPSGNSGARIACGVLRASG
jgi:Cu-Zn family superoxide dismutase